MRGFVVRRFNTMAKTIRNKPYRKKDKTTIKRKNSRNNKKVMIRKETNGN